MRSRSPLAILVALSMAVSGIAMGTSPVVAMTAPAAPVQSADRSASGVEQVQYRGYRGYRGGQVRGGRHYRGGRSYHRGRYHNPGHYHRYHRRNHGAAAAAGIIGLAAGAIIAGSAANAHRGSDWHAYCASRYRSYDPRTGTFLGYDGRRHPCR